MTNRCLRAANRGLYLGTSLLVLAACAYTLWRGGRPEWQLWLAGAAALATLLWGGHYAFLRYEVDAQGITRRSLFGKRQHLAWNELEEARFEQEEGMGTARATLHFRAKEGAATPALTLSSDLLPLDAVEELAAELREQGILPS